MERWNEVTNAMHEKCLKLGKDKCMIVRYEELILRPKQLMEKVLDFLDVPWDDSVFQNQEIPERDDFDP